MNKNINRLSKIHNTDVMYYWANNVYQFIHELEKTYPNITKWYFNKVIPSIIKGDGVREIIYVLDDNDNISATMILKDTVTEKKISSILVDKQHQRAGIGTALLKSAILYLGTSTPKITVPECKINDFLKIFKNFNFKHTDSVNNMYIDGITELIFN